MPKKLPSNVQEVTYFMNASPMNQAIVMTAIDRFTKEVIKNKANLLKEQRHAIISPAAWIKSAEDWILRYK